MRRQMDGTSKTRRDRYCGTAVCDSPLKVPLTVSQGNPAAFFPDTAFLQSVSSKKKLPSSLSEPARGAVLNRPEAGLAGRQLNFRSLPPRIIGNIRRVPGATRP